MCWAYLLRLIKLLSSSYYYGGACFEQRMYMPSNSQD